MLLWPPSLADSGLAVVVSTHQPEEERCTHRRGHIEGHPLGARGAAPEIDEHHEHSTEQHGRREQSPMVRPDDQPCDVRDHEPDERDAAGDGDDGAGQERCYDEEAEPGSAAGSTPSAIPTRRR